MPEVDPAGYQIENASRADLHLLLVHEPRYRIFFQNLLSLFAANTPESISAGSAPAAFWPDVFVDRSLPWRRFWQSCACHVLVLTLVWAGSRFLTLSPRVTVAPTFKHDDVIYYSPSEYLPPIDTRSPSSTRSQPADPEYSVQPVISVPPAADNRSQTVVTPPNIQLHSDLALPNIVSLLEKMPGDARMPIGPAPAVPASEISRLAPQLEHSVVAPPPTVAEQSHKAVSAPLAAVIAPPPAIETKDTRRLGDLNIGHNSVIAPAPQLRLEQQRALSGRKSAAVNQVSAPVIAPPPLVAGSGRSHSAGGFVALNLHPAVGAPPAPPEGNRRGRFAATPEGHRGASGTPGASAAAAGSSNPGMSNGKTDGTGSGKSAHGDLPSGLYVGKAADASTIAGHAEPKNSSAYSVNPNLIANLRPPRATERTTQTESESRLSQEERAVFGNRKFYSLSLNMPNLNSAGGSWIIRFAALHPNSDSGGPPSRAASASDQSASHLSAPVATSKVDPAYPLELMRQNLGGTVILYAVIHADGTVGDVRVLRSADERLDQYASAAIARWKFEPATKNGAAVDVEATFWIPFHPAHVGSSF